MADEHPRTVFLAETAELADAVVKLLAGSGIPAELFSQPARAESDPLTGMGGTSTPDEIEVRVTNEAQAAQAKELLGSPATAATVRAVRDKRANRTGTVTAVCEDCGKSSEWPASAMGTTEVCPYCTGYMDIPDPEENWEGVDFGEPEKDEEEVEEDEK